MSVTIKNNAEVMTPNGPGVVQGRMWESGIEFVLVRHQICKMTSKSAGLCVTPRAQVSGLWEYEPGDIS